MIPIALTIVAGVAAALLVHLGFRTRQRTLQARARQEIDETERSIRERDLALDQEFVDRIVSGDAVESRIATLQEERAKLLPPSAGSDRSWRWADDELRRWKRAEADERIAEVNRRLAVPWVATFTSVVVGTIALSLVLYGFEAGRTAPSSHAAVPTIGPGRPAPAATGTPRTAPPLRPSAAPSAAPAPSLPASPPASAPARPAPPPAIPSSK